MSTIKRTFANAFPPVPDSTVSLTVSAARVASTIVLTITPSAAYSGTVVFTAGGRAGTSPSSLIWHGVTPTTLIFTPEPTAAQSVCDFTAGTPSVLPAVVTPTVTSILYYPPAALTLSSVGNAGVDDDVVTVTLTSGAPIWNGIGDITCNDGSPGFALPLSGSGGNSITHAWTPPNDNAAIGSTMVVRAGSGPTSSISGSPTSCAYYKRPIPTYGWPASGAVGGTLTVTVSLNKAPSASISIRISPAGCGLTSANAITLAFTTAASQSYVFTPTSGGSIIFTPSRTTGTFVKSAFNPSPSIDWLAAPSIVITSTTPQAGSATLPDSVAYALSLSSSPGATTSQVRVTPSGAGTTGATPIEKDFTAANFGTPQSVLFSPTIGGNLVASAARVSGPTLANAPTSTVAYSPAAGTAACSSTVSGLTVPVTIATNVGFDGILRVTAALTSNLATTYGTADWTFSGGINPSSPAGSQNIASGTAQGVSISYLVSRISGQNATAGVTPTCTFTYTPTAIAVVADTVSGLTVPTTAATNFNHTGVVTVTARLTASPFTILDAQTFNFSGGTAPTDGPKAFACGTSTSPTSISFLATTASGNAIVQGAVDICSFTYSGGGGPTLTAVLPLATVLSEQVPVTMSASGAYTGVVRVTPSVGAFTADFTFTGGTVPTSTLYNSSPSVSRPAAYAHFDCGTTASSTNVTFVVSALSGGAIVVGTSPVCAFSYWSPNSLSPSYWMDPEFNLTVSGGNVTNWTGRTAAQGGGSYATPSKSATSAQFLATYQGANTPYGRPTVTALSLVWQAVALADQTNWSMFLVLKTIPVPGFRGPIMAIVNSYANDFGHPTCCILGTDSNFSPNRLYLSLKANGGQISLWPGILEGDAPYAINPPNDAPTVMWLGANLQSNPYYVRTALATGTNKNIYSGSFAGDTTNGAQNYQWYIGKDVSGNGPTAPTIAVAIWFQTAVGFVTTPSGLGNETAAVESLRNWASARYGF